MKATNTGHLKIVASDLQLLDDTQACLGGESLARASRRLPLASRWRYSRMALRSMLGKRLKLLGAGEPLTIRFSWRSEADGHEDHAQFLHLGHAESGEWWVYDQAPLGRVCRRDLWYKGLADSETWLVPLPADLAPGRYTVFSGLYRTRDKERAPARMPTGRLFPGCARSRWAALSLSDDAPEVIVPSPARPTVPGPISVQVKRQTTDCDKLIIVTAYPTPRPPPRSIRRGGAIREMDRV